MAMTLLEAAKINPGNVIRNAIIEMFADESDLLAALPFENIAGNAFRYNLEASLPGVGFRGVNEAFTESTGVLNPTTEALIIAGGDLDVDRFIIQTQGEAIRTTHERMKVKALAAAITSKIIKGDSSTNPREFDGWQRRITGSQVISNAAASGGAGLSLAKLDELIDAVDGPTHLVMSRAQRRKLIGAARDTGITGFITYDKDGMGKRVTRYNDLPILTAYGGGGGPGINGGDEVLPFNEAYTGGGTANGTSIYCAKLGGDGVIGLQNGVMDVRDLGELQSAPVYRTRVEWFMTQAVMQGRALARLRDISDTAVTK